MSNDKRVKVIYEYSKGIFEMIQANHTPDFISDKEESYIVDYLKVTKTSQDVGELASPSMVNKASFFRPFEDKYIVYDIYASEDYNIIINPFLLRVIYNRLKEEYAESRTESEGERQE